MSRKLKLTDDIKQDEPLAWLVFTPNDSEYDYHLYSERRDAERLAIDIAVDEGVKWWPIYPLWAGGRFIRCGLETGSSADDVPPQTRRE